MRETLSALSLFSLVITSSALELERSLDYAEGGTRRRTQSGWKVYRERVVHKPFQKRQNKIIDFLTFHERVQLGSGG